MNIKKHIYLLLTCKLKTCKLKFKNNKINITNDEEEENDNIIDFEDFQKEYNKLNKNELYEITDINYMIDIINNLALKTKERKKMTIK
jgi:hypothetical protein